MCLKYITTVMNYALDLPVKEKFSEAALFSALCLSLADRCPSGKKSV